MHGIRIRAYLLGDVQVIVNGRLVETPSRHGRDLILYLLLHRKAAVQRDVLVDTFWPRARPAAGRNRLHVVLAGVRKTLREASAEPVIERSGAGYRIAPAAEVWIDADEFERRCRAGRRADGGGDSAEALRQYESAGLLLRGEFLADRPYAEWAAPRREALRAVALEAQSRLLQLHTGRGEHGAAAALARRILSDDPCNEGAHRTLMLCYAVTGLRHLALLQYHELVTTLWADLRVRPAAETTDLYERLRRPERMPQPA
ncbi:AfsR/SARP family transcriptional regulator [Paractinoplanes globisporus]|uniref:BTAD domain-containing putative transcriptional regulator n=1 Tax=Paractinoplanes globisporus TaxID=113565 RepID=A0ABW6WLY8_9ACTN|nr:BTAD domain-containing putative transcriptional regulator [Actinoplanes globisporus]